MTTDKTTDMIVRPTSALTVIPGHVWGISPLRPVFAWLQLRRLLVELGREADRRYAAHHADDERMGRHPFAMPVPDYCPREWAAIPKLDTPIVVHSTPQDEP